jgi:hypothetical protein
MAQLDLSKYRGRQSASINSGGGAFDRKIPDNDHDPNRNKLDWNDPMGAIADAAGETGEKIRNAIVEVIKQLFGIDLSGWDNFLVSLNDGKGIDVPGLITAFTVLQELVANLGQAITDAFNGIPTAVGGLVSDVWNAIDGLLGIGHNAQQTADDGWTQIQALNAAVFGIGTSGLDQFDGSALTDPGPLYDERHWGGASNKYYRDGTGKMRFPTSGIFGNASVFARNDIHFVGGITTTAVYLGTKIPGTGSALLLLNRLNLAAGEGYCTLVTSSSIQAGYLVESSGVPGFHSLGSSSSYTRADGEYWEFDVGEADGSNDFMMRVRRNGTELHTYDDTAMTYPIDPAYVDIGVGGRSADGFPSIVAAPVIDTLSWYERA